MFSGLVEEVGQVRAVEDRHGASLIAIHCRHVLAGMQTGDVVAVNGVCQSVLALDARSLSVCAYQHTLRKTNLGLLQVGDRVNLERALTVGGRLSGHLTQGQVSGTALLLDVSERQGNIYFKVEVGADLLPYCLAQGAICLDGVSLTIAEVDGTQLGFNPDQQSWQRTNLPYRRSGDRLNVELDLIGRYVAAFYERQPAVSHRDARGHTVPEVEVGLPTEHGDFTLSLLHCPREPAAEHLLLSLNLLGTERPPKVPLIRVHSECLTGEVFRSQRCDCHWQLQTAMSLIQQEGCGAIVYLRQEGRGIGLRAKLQAYKLQQIYQLDTVDANLRLGYDDDLRSYHVAIDALKLLNLREVRLLTNNPDKMDALTGAGMRVERVPLEAPANRYNAHYLRTKKIKSGHLLQGGDVCDGEE